MTRIEEVTYSKNMAKLTLESFKNFFKHYNGEEHQSKSR